ncbi:hypothetical protein [Thermosediminibacter litoriperuensis]|uniref:Uncharacterized protein n=1 Tax=Thermosediminibacter litoriperuensis TaxID=291989 RepID=A0A5S5AKV8_9FIRM|nr:hypothetical protein [Thermosediminibacter litoriperuensis]TYP51683.1 hypothetical protein LZ11_01807 [Thermosediminibacter litoriperuensis]
MLVDSLIRLGKVLMSYSHSPRTIIKELSGLGDPLAGGFLQRIYIVEVYRSLEPKIVCSPPVCWGDFEDAGGKKSKKSIFRPDFERAIGTPFFLPQGGNPRKPQGYYPVPVYIVYDGDFREFSGNADKVASFLKGRLARTEDPSLTEDELKICAESISSRVRETNISDKGKLQALIAICIVDEDSPYRLKPSGARIDERVEFKVTDSFAYPGMAVYADLTKILDRLWRAKLTEGAESGQIDNGICVTCGKIDKLVSLYNKSWPLFLPTWSCPLPQVTAKKELNLAEKTGGLCQDCYKALTYGASAFRSMEKDIPGWLTKELFAPVDSPGGRDNKKAGTASVKVTGCAYPAPVEITLSEEDMEFLGEEISLMVSREHAAGRRVRDIQSVVGFESLISEEGLQDAMRLYIVYYSGDRSKGDVHLRATMEDVLPSILIKLDDVAKSTAMSVAELSEELHGSKNEEHYGQIRSRYGSIPWLLANAYGPGYMWQTLEKVMTGKKLDHGSFIAGCGHRMSALSRTWPDSQWKIFGEVLFFHGFASFLSIYHSTLGIEGGMCELSDWKGLRKLVVETPAEDMVLDTVEKVGFAAGYVIQEFSRRYYAVKAKDFIKHRVMVFGSSLSPDVIWSRGLARLEEYAKNLDIYMEPELSKKNAVTMLAYNQLRDRIKAEKDLFIASFWSGYALSAKTSEKN